MAVYVLYLDESGVPERAGQTSHYAMAGIAIPARTWTKKRDQLGRLRDRFGLASNAEIHVAWLLRPYPEQLAVADFDTLPWDARRKGVEIVRRAKLRAMPERVRRTQAATYRKTAPYVHLTSRERSELAAAVCDLAASWTDAVLFGEVADKSVRTPFKADESAYEQVITRFDAWLQRVHGEGVVAYDHSDSVIQRFLDLTERFQEVGGVWRRVRFIPGHPFFVDSKTSDMVQIADVIAYGLRRYAEKRELDLFVRYFDNFDRKGKQLVGLRHYRGGRRCTCMICREPRTQPRKSAARPKT